MSNWFYICQWNKTRLKNIGLEMNQKDAERLYNSILAYDSKKYYFALVRKNERWKVISDKKDIGDWSVVDKNS